MSSVTAPAVWLPILTFILGFASKLISDSIQHRYERERDRESRMETRRDQLSERRRNFQRETLLALQEATMDLFRATGAAHHQDEMAYRTTGKWQKQLLETDLNNQHLLAIRRTTLLEVRVRDDSIRQIVAQLKNYAAQTIISVGRDASNEAASKMLPLFEQIQERIGQLLRTLDDEETAALGKS